MNRLLVHLRQAPRYGVGYLAPAARFLFHVHARRRLIQSQTDSLELAREDLFVRVLAVGGFRLGRVQDHQDEVGGLGDRDHLAASAFALGGALDDPGKVEQLDLRVVVMDHAGDARERGELVRGGFGVRAGSQSQQRGLPHRGKSDQRDPAVSVLRHLEPVALAAAALGGSEQLRAELGEFRLQDAEMPFRGLVLLRAGHLQLDVLDLLQDPHGADVFYLANYRYNLNDTPLRWREDPRDCE